MAALNVIIPPGMKPGQEIQAQSPDGTLAPWSADVPAVRWFAFFNGKRF
jgi:hypothetical protein